MRGFLAWFRRSGDPPSSCQDDAFDAVWRWKHWWSNSFELQYQGRTIASVQIQGSKGVAIIQGQRFTVHKLRQPAAITIREAESDDLVARFLLEPTHELGVEFRDGDSFLLGWSGMFPKQLEWSRQSGVTVMVSIHPMRGKCVALQVIDTLETKWPILAVLLIARSKLASPAF